MPFPPIIFTGDTPRYVVSITMAITHISTILCDYLIRADNGRNTYAGVFKNIAGKMPLRKGPFGVGIEFKGNPGDPFKVTIEGNGINVLLTEGVIDPEPIVSEFHQLSLTISGEIGLQFETPGVFEVILYSGDEIVHRTAYGVVLKEDETNDGE